MFHTVASRLSGHVARVVPDLLGSVVGVIARGIPHHWHRHGFAIARGVGISQSESRLWFYLIQCLLIAWLGYGSCWKAMMFNDFRKIPRFCCYNCGKINLVANALTSSSWVVFLLQELSLHVCGSLGEPPLHYNISFDLHLLLRCFICDFFLDFLFILSFLLLLFH